MTGVRAERPRTSCTAHVSAAGGASPSTSRDERLGRRVVLKTLRANVQPSSPLAGQIRHEGEVLAGMSHAGVVLLFDRGADAEGRPYLVLEHVDGFALRDLVAKKRPVAPASALAIACGMLAGLEHAHARGIVHRDVKPGNVLLSRTGEVKLCDFGIALEARRVDDDVSGLSGSVDGQGRARTATGFGTPGMSPEQLLDCVTSEPLLRRRRALPDAHRCPAVRRGTGGQGLGRGRARRARVRARRRGGAGAAAPRRAPDVPRALGRTVLRLLEAGRSTARLDDRVSPAPRRRSTGSPASPRSARAARARRRGPARRAARVRRHRRRARSQRPGPGTARVWVGLFIGSLLFGGAAFASRAGCRGPRAREAEPTPATESALGALRVLATPWAGWVDSAVVDVTPFAPIRSRPGRTT